MILTKKQLAYKIMEDSGMMNYFDNHYEMNMFIKKLMRLSKSELIAKYKEAK